MLNTTYVEYYLVNDIGNKYIFTVPSKIHVYVVSYIILITIILK